MSGQLVGEVIAAAPALKARGLTERGFAALIAIADRCHTETRQASVRWDHIRAGLFDASLSTAKRAVKDLKSAGLVRVVKRGFDNHHGRSCAPIYEIQQLCEQVTQVTQSPSTEQVTQVTQSPEGQRVKPGGPTGQTEGRTGQTGGPTGHPGDLLDGSIDGSTDGTTKESARRKAPPPPPEGSHLPATVEETSPRHPAVFSDKPARTRRRNPVAPIPDDFAAPDSEIAKILARFPNATRADIDRETYKFVNHFQANGQQRAGWLASWRKWMANADGYGNFTGTRHLSTSDKRVADIQALKTHHQRELGA